jgi:hypothetical protein
MPALSTSFDAPGQLAGNPLAHPGIAATLALGHWMPSTNTLSPIDSIVGGIA